MSAKLAPAEARRSIDDFELVRNGDGQWLLVLQDLPPGLEGDPAQPIKAEVIDDEAVLHLAEGSFRLRSLVAGHYLQALRTDKPSELILCVVDDDGVRRFLRKIPIHL